MRPLIIIYLAIQSAALAMPVMASELIYTPVNPAFGGNPLNGAVLLNEAQAINDYKDPALAAQQKTPSQQFSDTLQRSIISRLSFSAASGLVDANGNLVATAQPLQTTDFTINITNLAGTGNMQVTVVDRVTGQTTSFNVCQPASVSAGATACVP